jgi:hypothetical protein
MDSSVVTGIINTRNEMREAVHQLSTSLPMLTTKEAVAQCPLGHVSAETLTSYPDHVLPRIVLRPGARRATYRWDPRDLLALPSVLRRWQRAVEENREEEFKRERIAELLARDESKLPARQEAA